MNYLKRKDTKLQFRSIDAEFLAGEHTQNLLQSARTTKLKGTFTTDEITVVPMNFIVTSQNNDQDFEEVTTKSGIYMKNEFQLTMNDKIAEQLHVVWLCQDTPLDYQCINQFEEGCS